MTLQFITPYSVTVGVVGAGVMGSGIALTALLAGMPASLYDVSPEMLQKARGYIEEHLKRKNKASSLRDLRLTGTLEDLRDCGVVIETAPEDLGVKQDLFARLSALLPPPAILATNTSTLAVTAIAAAAEAPERVAGMHFFNPAPVLPLVEVVRGAQTRTETVESLVALAERLGKTPVIAADTPGFIVNRVARPFYGEALRLLGEGAASFEQIDLIVRLGGGFRMGPFQLMDLIGIDVNFAAMQSMYEQTFGEPRYRPHPIQRQMVQQGALGRKSGRGFYRYEGEGPAPEPAPSPARRGTGKVLLSAGGWGQGLDELIQGAGYTLTDETSGRPAISVAASGRKEGLEFDLVRLDRRLPPESPILCQCADVTLAEAAAWIGSSERLVGFDGLFFSNGPVATLVASSRLTPTARHAAEEFVASLGRLPVWVQDSPGLVLPRIVAMLANEAAFAVLEGVAEAETIDVAMRLGVNYPLGPLAWAKALGHERVLAVLDHLYSEYHEERYRAAPLLRRWVRSGK